MRRVQLTAAGLMLCLVLAGCGAKKQDDHGHDHAHEVPHEAAKSAFIVQDKPIAAAQQIQGKTGVVTMIMTDRGYEPSEVRVKFGDQVRIYLKNNGAKEHNLVIPQFKVATSNMANGADNYIEFTANIKGEFPFFSDAPNAAGKAEPGLRGTLKVE